MACTTCVGVWVGECLGRVDRSCAQAGLVASRKEGRWIYYQLPAKDAPVVVREALDWIKKALADNPHVLADNQRLKKVLKQDPAELCKRQCGK